jgi:cyclopropane fatty-acyl-phospholipid synthase-like methyltransferase
MIATTALGGTGKPSCQAQCMREYERWEGRFGADGYLFGTAPNAFLAAQKARLPKHGRALSVADGEGRNGVWLAEQGLDVVSMDFSPAAQVKARKLAAERGVSITTEQVDLSNWAWPENAYDVIVVIFAQPLDRDMLFAGVRHALKPGGLLLIEGYTPKQLAYGTGGPSDVERLYTREQIERAFTGMSAAIINEYDAEIYEGDGHGGMSAVIDLIATK